MKSTSVIVVLLVAAAGAAHGRDTEARKALEAAVALGASVARAGNETRTCHGSFGKMIS